MKRTLPSSTTSKFPVPQLSSLRAIPISSPNSTFSASASESASLSAATALSQRSSAQLSVGAEEDPVILNEG